MKRQLAIIAVLLLVCSGADAQNILGRITERAKNAAENAISNKIENAIYNTVDKATSKREKKNNKQEQEAEEQEPQEQQAPEVQYPQEPVANAEPQAPNATVSTVLSDFVQGAVVLFEDDFANEQIGEFPSKWDLDEGTIAVATIGNRKVAKFDGEGKILPLMEKDPKNYLPEVFTLEWDMYFCQQGDYGEIYDFIVGLCGEDSYSDVRLWYRSSDTGRNVSWNCDKPSGGSVQGDAGDDQSYMKVGGWNHFAISFNKRAFKLYVNGTRVANVPNMKAPQYVFFEYGNSFHYPYCCISNVRLGAGAVELYGRNASTLDPGAAAAAVEKAMTETGKFVTNNILFETGKATLMPESMADIQSVAEYMKKNTTIRFEVQGHCDNQGSDKVNDPLSQQRAEAIVAELVKLGVDEWNLRAVGKGSHEPVADNSTEEGRAQNRRVEFIKK